MIDQSPISPEAGIKKAQDIALGRDHIPLKQAIAEGVPAPPLNLVVGKQWLIETSSSTKQGLTLTMERFEITSSLEDQACFEVQSEIIARTRNNEDILNGSPDHNRIQIDALWADGRLHRPEGLVPEDEWRSRGRLWPEGRIRLGDKWAYATRTRTGEQDFSLEAEISIQGFDSLEGHDCLIYETIFQSTFSRRSQPVVTRYRHRTHLDYNLGLEVFWQSLEMNEQAELVARLAEFRFPGPQS